MCINTLKNFYDDKKKYYKHVEIANGKIKFKEITSHKTSEWEEKIRKYSSIDLHHFNYRGTRSWYIFLKHPEKKYNIALFAPEYKYQNADENLKRETLSFYGKLFDLPTNYLTLEESYKASNPEEEKKEEKK